MNSQTKTLYIKSGMVYLDENHTIEVGAFSENSQRITLWKDDVESIHCIFCGTPISKLNSGSIEFAGIDKLDRLKQEKTNETDQKLNNICSPCILGIYRMVFGGFRASKHLEKCKNEEMRTESK